MTRPDLSRLSSEEMDALILALLEQVADKSTAEDHPEALAEHILETVTPVAISAALIPRPRRRSVPLPPFSEAPGVAPSGRRTPCGGSLLERDYCITGELAYAARVVVRVRAIGLPDDRGAPAYRQAVGADPPLMAFFSAADDWQRSRREMRVPPAAVLRWRAIGEALLDGL